MPEKLDPIDRIGDETGMLVGLVGFFIALGGAILAFTALPTVGYWIGLSGALLGLVGGVLHFIKHWRSILRIDLWKR